MDYRDSGVDKERGYELLRSIQSSEKQTSKAAKVLGGIGGFAALYALSGYEEPVLVSGTDGVGTKLKLAFDFGNYSGVGQDCVAMCANDILCLGAEPLFFLDYIACEQLQVERAAALVESISQACAKIDIPLVGGETAEMPGFYKDGLYDLAGFCVGVVERKEIRGPELTQAGDIIIGLSSSGLHSNGFSLVRKILAECEQKLGPIDYDRAIILKESGQYSLSEVLLEPTALYVQLVHMLLRSQWGQAIHAMAHITGGGIYENLPRAFGIGQCAEVYRSQIAKRQIFDFLQDPRCYLYPGENLDAALRLEPDEMWHTFNMGLGFAIIVAEEAVENILQLCDQHQHASLGQELISGTDAISASIIGRVKNRDNVDLPQVQLLD